jgi:hypothetical protein
MRNFGEALYHTLQEDGWGSISLHEIDSGSFKWRSLKTFTD